jgi:DNA-binding FrmR family transcriptional regulator
MTIVRIAVGVSALVLGAQMLFAQQPEQRSVRPADSMMAKSGMAQQQMRMMDSLNARLDTLVSRMNRATGNKKVTAMADVINQLVAQRKAMQEHMREMMQSRGGMRMHMMEAPAPVEARPSSTAEDSAAEDSAAHERHHPPD